MKKNIIEIIKNIPSFFKITAAISFAGIVLRLLVAWQINDTTPFVMLPPTTTDLATYMTLSHEIVDGNFEGAFYYQPFYYAAFLPAVLLIFGKSVWAVITVQAFLGGLTIFFAAWSAKKLYNEKSGYITAALLLVSNVLIFYTPFHKIATLQTFLVTMFTFFLIMAFKDEKERWQYWAAAGIFLGAGCATRGNLYVMLVGIIPLIFWKFKIKKASAFVGLMLLMTIMVQLPFIIRNSLIEKRLCGSSTASSAVLALGNSPEAPPGGLEYPESYQLFMKKENENIRSVPMQIIDYFLSEPAAYIELTFRKVILFYDCADIPNNVNMARQGGKFLNNNIFGWVGWILILGVGGMLYNLIGMFKKRDFGMMIVFANIFFYGLSIAMFYNLARFRAPILPTMAVCGGIFAIQLYEKIKIRNYKNIAVTLIFGVAIPLALFPAYGSYEKHIMRLVRPDGTHIESYHLKGYNAVFDNGPQQCGDWQLMQLNRGDVIEKTFAGVPDNAEGLLMISPFPNAAVLLEIDSQRMLWQASPDSRNLQIPCKLKDGKISIRIIDISSPGSPGIILDSKRDYGRSSYNGNALPGEYVMRFYYKE